MTTKGLSVIPTQLIIGTRGSPLALWQSQYVAQQIRHQYPGIDVQIRIISTQGDRDQHTPLPLVGGKGVFTVELERALFAGDIHLAVHSLKDMPTETTAGLSITAIPARASAADVIVSRHGYTWHTLPHGACVGSSSTRRKAQLLNRRPDLRIMDIRGNIDSRIAKAMADDSPYDAIILAEAGLARLGLISSHTHILDTRDMIPAPGQGALAIQTIDTLPMRMLLDPIHHHETALATTAERTILHELGGGCSAPVAVHATLSDASNHLHIALWVGTPDGTHAMRAHHIIPCTSTAEVIEAGHAIAHTLIEQGAQKFLQRARE
jgi:hydroxymethylbilane synthase